MDKKKLESICGLKNNSFWVEFSHTHQDKNNNISSWKSLLIQNSNKYYSNMQSSIQNLMAMSQTYVISSDFGHDIFHGSVDQLILWTCC